MEFIVTSVEETYNIGKLIGSLVNPGDIICLIGDLGTGKTHLAKGIASGLGIKDHITSPTFTIVNEYHKNDINIFHFDVYRLEDSSEFYEIGGDEYFENGICLIEWGELIKDALPKDYIHITFSKNDNNENLRNLLIESNLNLDSIIK